MGKTLYLECASGISGDMTVAALLDLGADQAKLEAALASLPVEGYQVRVSRVKKAALDCCDFDVVLDAAHENHDHDMAYLFGHEHGQDDGSGHEHEHAHGHDHGHDAAPAHEHGGPDGGGEGPAHNDDHSHGHGHDAHAHHHEHRGLAEIEAIIDAGDLTEGARSLAKRIFRIIGEAESKAHGAPIDQVHFHEVGAVDSIVDIVAAAVCLDDLGITSCIIPQIAEGSGTVRSAHGILPIPVPAVVNIAAAHGLVLTNNGMHGEFVTPTGAAIAAAICTGTELPRRMRVLRTGLGAGKRAYERPSILRAMLIEDADAAEGRPLGTAARGGSARKGSGSAASGDADALPGNAAPVPPSGEAPSQSDANASASGTAGSGKWTDRFDPRTQTYETGGTHVWKLECEIDDATGEQLGRALDAIIGAGALEAHYLPVFMKKNRPGWQLQVLCREEDIARIEETVFRATTTIGIRRAPMERTVLPRTYATVDTPYGPIAVKRVTLPDGTVRAYPEYDSVAEACERTGASYQAVYAAAFSEAGKQAE